MGQKWAQKWRQKMETKNGDKNGDKKLKIPCSFGPVFGSLPGYALGHRMCSLTIE
jgi:hypothetical protein